MLVYMDVFTGDEMINDAEPAMEVKDKDGNVVEGLLMVQSRLVTKGGEEIDVGGGGEFGGGEGEEADDQVETVNHLADENIGFGYTEYSGMDKATFKDYFKVYMKKVMKHHKAEGKIEDFATWAKEYKVKAAAAYKFLLSKFGDLEIYMGKSNDFSAGLVYAIWEGEAAEPCFMFFKDGLKGEKF
jgi:hypothetical protein